MKRTPLIAGNWKMNTSLEEATDLATAVAAAAPADIELVVCPPFPWLLTVATAIAGSRVKLGAQNCWIEPKGAFTGEISPAMLRPTCTFVIAGHSERRALFAEDDDLVGRKVKAIMEQGMTPILCVGESLAQREAGQAHQIVTRQISAGVARIEATDFAHLVVAYEPVWAIGTGIAASPADAAEMMTAIRETLHTVDPVEADQVRLIYGGSVTTESAPTLLGQENIDGALVGGASLSAVDFLAIAQAARR